MPRTRQDFEGAKARRSTGWLQSAGRVAVTCLSGLVALTGLMMLFEEHLIFFPERVGVGPSPGEEVWLTAADGVRVHGWHLARPGARAALLHLHGNAGHLEGRRDLIVAMADLGIDVLAIDYRGYGKSAGRPNEPGLYADARAAYDWLRAREPGRPVIVHGESLGGGPACELARHSEIAGLILQSTFTSIPDMAAEVYPWLPLRRFVRTRFENLRKISEVRVPTLVVHSRRDEFIPFAMGERLYEAARGPKQHVWLASARHNDALISERQALLGGIEDFLRQHGLLGR